MSNQSITSATDTLSKFARKAAILGIVAVAIPQALGQNEHNPAGHSRPAILIDGMGDVRHQIATNNSDAQRFFNQGLAMIYGFNRPEALRSFQHAAELDPNAAMAYWGVALSLGLHVNMDTDGDVQLKLGYEAIQKAVALSVKSPEHERAYIEALAKRFSSDEKADEKKLSAAYREAMRGLSRRYPDDLDAATFYAESIMCLSRWNYWNADGTPKNGTDEMVAILEEVLRRDADHLGANHYYIHAVEASPTPERALPSAARLMGLAPAAGHLVHMPGHIFMRTGNFTEVAFTNERAVKADQDYIKLVDAQPSAYTMGYYPHNMHFIVVARSMQGRFEDAKKMADQLAAYVAPGIAVMPSMVDYFAPNQIFVLMRFNRWDEILKVSKPSPRLPASVAYWHFARASAYANKRMRNEATAERAALAECRQKSPKGAILNFNLVDSLIEITEHIVDARLAPDAARGIEHWKKAVAVQDTLAYDEPPAFFYPVRESLGAALLRAGRAPEAEAVFREDLRRNPRNGRSLFGLMKSLEAQNRTFDAQLVGREFERAWKFAQVELRIEDL